MNTNIERLSQMLKRHFHFWTEVFKDEETGETTKAIVESTFLFNGNNYVVLILDTDETDEDGEIIQDYVIMRFVDKGGDVLLESLVEKEEDVIYDYYEKLCDELYGDDEESENE